MKNRLYIQLGRAGDVMNILPLCKRDFDRTGDRPVLMVSEGFASILEGVSYVEPLIAPGPFEELIPATLRAGAYAEGHDLNLICTQIYGNGFVGSENCSSFCRESWSRVPDAPAWGSLPLVFDRRDQQKEDMVKAQLLKNSTGKPYVVLALSGTSSPFEHGPALKRYLQRVLGHVYDFVDISGFLAPRIFDLLSTIKGAHALVSIDAGVLHLAAAVPNLRVVPFVTREPSKWHGTPWRSQHVRRFYYDEAPECFRDVEMAVYLGDVPEFAEKIFHCYTHLELGASEDTNRRNSFARSTWFPEYFGNNWIGRPFGSGELARSSADHPIDDERPIPFMHDVINHAIDGQDARDTDIIAWTNADSCFVPGLTGLILDIVRKYEAAYTHRWDFHQKLTTPLTSEAEIRRGEWYPGTDACFFTVRWWKKHCVEYPDMLVGREQNDEVLRQLIKARGGLEIPASIYHEKHQSFWEHHGRRMTGNGNLHNQRLARGWFRKMGFRPLDPIWWQLEPEQAQREWALSHVKLHGPA